MNLKRLAMTLAAGGALLMGQDLPVAGNSVPSKPPTIQQASKHHKKKGVHKKRKARKARKQKHHARPAI